MVQSLGSAGPAPYDAAVERFRVVGGARLEGEVQVAGAKNSVLKLMAAALLAPGRTVVRNVPDILDVEIMAELLRRLGCDVAHERADRRRRSTSPTSSTTGPTTTWSAGCARRSTCSARWSPAAARPRSRCPVATRSARAPLDFHVAGLREDGRDGRERARLHRRQGAARAARARTIYLDFPSVGATENLLVAAVLAEGMSVIDNAAREPEIVDLCRMLVRDGRPDRRHRHLDARDRPASRGCTPPTTRPCPTGWSPAPGPSARR